MKYKINEILHSGRDDSKYDGLVGSVVELKGLNVIEDCKQFTSLTMLLVHSDSAHNYWKTCAVIGISKSFHGEYYIETINNTIYVLEEFSDGE